jgi:O-antigen/teichoic acid export membrane protein
VAFPLGLASQFVLIYFRTDAVMIEAMVGEAAAGQYGAAYRLLEALMLSSAIITTVVYPRLASLYHRRTDAEGFTQVVLRSAAGLFGLGLAIALGLSLLAGPIMLFVKGDPSFTPAANALKILAWAAPFMCLNGLLSITLSATDDQRWLAAILGVAALMNLVLNFVLIPVYSFFGACAATLLTEGTITLMLGLRYYRHTHVRLALPV